MKIIIAGGRDFNNYELVKQTMNELNILVSEIVCGGAQGADSLGERWAQENEIPIKYFHADWEKFGNAAGIIRNRKMAEYEDYLVAFWDEKSRGTKNMIDEMRNLGKHGKVILY